VHLEDIWVDLLSEVRDVGGLEWASGHDHVVRRDLPAVRLEKEATVGDRQPPRGALSLAFASDTASITVMEITDNAFILLVPGAIDAGLGEALFWWSLGVSLLVAFVFAFPLNRWLISRGRGHAVIHAYHGHGG
jgi:hypothetical protein